MSAPVISLQEVRNTRAAKRAELVSPDLGHLFERIIRSWGADHVHHLEEAFGPKADLPMERMALLSGTLRGILVLRSSREFPAWLQRQRVGLVPPGTREAEAFEELLTLFSLYLFHDFWVPDSFTVGPIHPFPSIPRDWPEETPTAARALLVEGFKVELRLWKMA